MKKFLLTWYGITDFRASLGFENTDGPIAGALAAEDYSDVVILCYTRVDNNESIEVKNSFAAELASICDSDQQKNWKTTSDFVSKFANTPVAHEHFVRWLKKKCHTAGSSTKIWFKSEKLRELNDTEGIYACAMQALDLVGRESGEKLITLYLSPGTPVMAFVWAFAALEHSEIKKRLIASPVMGKPPETVSLPAEWLDRYAVKQKAMRDVTNGFDVIFHLFGEQRMPSLLGIRQFESNRHVFVNSKEFPAACMREFLHDGAFDELSVDPWDARVVRDQIIHHAKKLPVGAGIGINLTGGTKLMFAGALSAARVLGAVPFYFDSRNHRVTFIDSLFSEIIRPIESIEDFLLLNSDGLKMSQKGEPEELLLDRCRLTEMLWRNQAKIARCYNRLREFNNEFKPFIFENENFYFELGRDASAVAKGRGFNMHFESWPDFAKYLSGGWFEEYVYLQCKPYEDAGVIKDLRINVKLQLDQGNSGWSSQLNTSLYNELDVVFTDGYSLYIVECKAGNVTQEQVMKLQNLVRFYGGVEGRGIVACCFKPDTESVQKKINDARLKLCYGKSFSEQLNALMSDIAKPAKSIGESI